MHGTAGVLAAVHGCNNQISTRRNGGQALAAPAAARRRRDGFRLKGGGWYIPSATRRPYAHVDDYFNPCTCTLGIKRRLGSNLEPLVP